jgi:hypothetical protein
VTAFMLSGRGGPIVTAGIALLFLWMALNGERPSGWSYRGEPSKTIGTAERIVWAVCGIGLLLYEVWKLHNWAQDLHN